MNFVKTNSFKLAIYSQGEPTSPKLALVLPGRLDTKDYSHMTSHVNYLAKHGFFAVSFDPPGTWKSPGDVKLYTMTNYLKAINELIKYYGNKPTFVMGHSRGATMAMLAGTKNSYVTSFASIMSSFPKGGYKRGIENEWKKKGYVIEPRDLPPGGGPKKKQLKLSYKFYEDQFKFDITEDLKKSTKPKLFMYGSRDVLAEPKVVKEIYELAGKPKQFYKLNSDHDYRHDQKLIEEVNKYIGVFLNKFNL